MKLISKTFSKQLFSTALLKEHGPAPFVEHPGHRLLSAKVSKNEIDKQIALKVQKRRCSVKEAVLEVLLYSPKNTCVGVSLIMLQL